MGAQTVTGKGNGSAEGSSQGTYRQVVQSDYIAGPHVVDCGTVQMHNNDASYCAGRVFFKHELPSLVGYSISITLQSPYGAMALTAVLAQKGVAIHNFTTTLFDIVSGFYDENWVPIAHWTLFKVA
jgi:hypothetical protein